MSAELQLHVHNDLVWFATGSAPACCSQLGAEPFVQQHITAGDGVRLLGSAANAALAVSLFRAGANVMLGGPALVRETSTPDDTLAAIWLASRSTDPLCPWHRMQAMDFRAYTLTAAVKAGREDLLSCLPSHPAWPAVSFVPDCDRLCCCRLLATMVDPRWFVHPHHPSRLTRLYAWLGLSLANMTGWQNHPVAALAIGAWWPQGQTEPQGQGWRDEDFLARIYSSRRTHASGLLAATRRFIGLLTHVWNDSCGRTLFDPASFFKLEAERAAWVAHRAKNRFVSDDPAR